MKTLDNFILNLLKLTPTINKFREDEYSWEYKKFKIKVADWTRTILVFINDVQQGEITKETYFKIKEYTETVWIKLDSKIQNDIRGKKIDNITK